MNRVRWLVGPIMYWIPVRSKRYHTKPCQSNYVLDTGKKLSCPTRGRHATLHLLQKTISEDVQTKLFSGTAGQGISFIGVGCLESVWKKRRCSDGLSVVGFLRSIGCEGGFVYQRNPSSFVIYCQHPQISYSSMT